MKVTHLRILFSLAIIILLTAHEAFAQEKKTVQKPFTPDQLMKMDHDSKLKLPTGPSFEVIFADGSRTMYTVLLHSEDRSFAQALMDVPMLDLMEAIIVEAKKFGLTEESVGGAKPITTRFSDKQLPVFFVDVSKLNQQTRFYITLKGNGSVVTIDAGGFKRSEKQKTENEPKEPILFDKMLDRIHAVRQSGQ